MGGGKTYAKGKAKTVNGVYYPSFEEKTKALLEEYGCLHFKFSVLLGVSTPAHTKEQLAQLKANDKKTFEFEGKKYTKYEASQTMSQIESRVKKLKDRANIATAAGDDDLRREEQYKINLLTNKYAKLSKASGLPTKMERMQVAGFRKVKTKAELTQSKNRAILKEKINNGEIKLELNLEKQSRHFKDSKDYKQGKSYLTINEERINELISQKSGTGVIHISNNMQQIKEVVVFDEVIGVDIDNKTGIETKTYRGTIHYSSTGTHLVPTKNEVK